MLQPHHAQISLTTLPLSFSVSVPESDDDARHRRRKDFVVFVTSLAIVAIPATMALWTAFLAPHDDKQREWGMGVLLLIVGGCVGYLTGKSAK